MKALLLSIAALILASCQDPIEERNRQEDYASCILTCQSMGMTTADDEFHHPLFIKISGQNICKCLKYIEQIREIPSSGK